MPAHLGLSGSRVRISPDRASITSSTLEISIAEIRDQRRTDRGVLLRLGQPAKEVDTGHPRINLNLSEIDRAVTIVEQITGALDAAHVQA